MKIGYPLANHPPRIIKKFKDTVVDAEVREIKGYGKVKEYFTDYEDGTEMTYSAVSGDQDLLSAFIDKEGNVNLIIPKGNIGTCR